MILCIVEEHDSELDDVFFANLQDASHVFDIPDSPTLIEYVSSIKSANKDNIKDLSISPYHTMYPTSIQKIACKRGRELGVKKLTF